MLFRSSIGDTELAIDNDWMTVTDPHPLGLDHLFMPTSRNSTEIVLINDEILRGDLTRKSPISCIGPGLDHGIWLLAKEHENEDNESQRRKGK